MREGDIIGIDVGTTAVTFADALKARFTRLTVITQSLDVFKELCGFAKFTVILLGGEYNSSENALDGVLTVQMLESLHMQKVFIFPCAISHDLEIFNFSDEMYLTERRMIKSADKVFVLADNTKFGKECYVQNRKRKGKLHVYKRQRTLRGTAPALCGDRRQGLLRTERRREVRKEHKQCSQVQRRRVTSGRLFR